MSEKTRSSKCLRLSRSYMVWAACAIAMPAFADPADWAPELGRQLKSEKACKVMLILNVKEYHLLDRDIVEARVNCTDGRSFDVVRRGRRSPFKIEYCKPITC